MKREIGLMFEDEQGKVEWEKHNHFIERGDEGEMLREDVMQVSLLVRHSIS